MDQNEPLVLKVMRLRRPHAEAPTPLATFDGHGVCPDDAPKLLLPMSLTQSLVGEPFTGYLNLANYSAVTVSNVLLKVKLQIGPSSEYILFDNSASPSLNIEPGDFFDTDVEHDIRDAGTYVLTCHVSYSMPSVPEPCTFKRSYRFPALQPFAVTHRVVQFDTRLLIECSVENATVGRIYLTSVQMDCRDGFEASLLDGVPSSATSSSLPYLLKPRGAHSLVFTVTPKSDKVDAAFVRDLDVVGNLVLGWRIPDGPAGRVECHQIKVKACDTPVLDMCVVSCPKQVSVEVPFQLDVQIVNRTARAADPSLVFDLHTMKDVRVHGTTQHAAGRLEPYSSTRVPLHLLVSKPGLHELKGVSLLDELTHARCEFGVLCDILAF